MNKPILFSFLLLLAYTSQTKGKAMAGSKQYEECQAGCLTCIQANSNLCYFCDDGYMWNSDGKTCKSFTSRDIPGIYRSCVECPQRSAVMSDFTCMPCVYGCLECVEDGTCTKCDTSKGFTLNSEGECTCAPGRLGSNGICYCQKYGFYVDPVTFECKECSFTTRKYPNCPNDCPEGYYDMGGTNCGICDSSCKTCVGPREDQCNSCKPQFEKVAIGKVNGVMKYDCLCKCDTMEYKYRECKCIDHTKTINSNGECI